MSDFLPPRVVPSVEQKPVELASDVMDTMDYDPIKNLINLRNRLAQEDVYWRNVRDGYINQVRLDGRVTKYSQMVHATVITQMRQIDESLLRYKYSRVSENIAPMRNRPVYNFNLTKDAIDAEFEDLD